MTSNFDTTTYTKYLCYYCNTYFHFNEITFCNNCNYMSYVCNYCFSNMELKYQLHDIVCHLCKNIYYGKLRNSIVKYALYNTIGIENMTNKLLQIWKINSNY